MKPKFQPMPSTIKRRPEMQRGDAGQPDGGGDRFERQTQRDDDAARRSARSASP